MRMRERGALGDAHERDGLENEMFDSPCDNFMHSFQSMSVLCQTQTYTRAKRFKK